MDVSQILFSFKDRIPRSTWWLVLLAWLLALLPLGLFMAMVIDWTGLAGALILFGVLWVALLWISFAVGAKRLHDRDRTGWWQAVPIAISAIAALSLKITGGSLKEPSTAAQLLDLVSAGFSLWLFVEMGFLRGTRGPNRFGPDPLGTSEADAKL